MGTSEQNQNIDLDLYADREGPTRSEPNAMAMLRRDAQKIDGDGPMLRCDATFCPKYGVSDYSLAHSCRSTGERYLASLAENETTTIHVLL